MRTDTPGRRRDLQPAEPMGVRARVADVLAARDPARARLTVATAVSAGVLASALVAITLIHAFTGDAALLPVGLLLSVQAGNMVKDRTARGRVLTTALLIPAVLIAILLAAALSPYRPAVIAVFVGVTGGAIWMRRFGPRAAAIGSLSFMGYFFCLFTKPTTQELPLFCLIAACAVATQLLARSALLLTRPRHQVAVLLREFCNASGAAVRAASHPARGRARRDRLARVDDVARAITAWQQSFRTERQLGLSEESFASQVLDARVYTEEACAELARIADAGRTPPPALTDALTHLDAVLDEHASPARIAGAAAWAQRCLAQAPEPGADGRAPDLLAQAVSAHVRLRSIDLSSGLGHDAGPVRAPAPPPRTRSAPHLPRPRWIPWSQWAPTTRMAVQAMVAASVASIVGEAISASRWYWAVMTAFIIFIGSTTRGNILTRAVRRVSGTALGIGIGIVAVALAGDDTPVLIGLCVISVFGMLYFGPLNYLYTAVFMTVMVVTLYRMLGVLDQSLLELRLVETLSGAVIGVLCAYLILTSTSRPALIGKVSAYFDALDALLAAVDESLTAPAPATPARVPTGDVLARLRDVEAAQVNVEQAVSAMATAFFFSGPARESDAIHLLYVATRSAAQLVQASSRQDADAIPETRAAIARVMAASTRARRILCSTEPPPPDARREPAVATDGDRLPPSAAAEVSAEVSAARALGTMEWALDQISDRDRSHR